MDGTKTPTLLHPDRFNQALTMTSCEIAELTGKEHKHVIRDIRAMLDELEKDGPVLDHPQEDKDARGYTTCFYLNRELTDTLLTGYSAIARRAVIARWHKLEAEKAAPAFTLPDFTNPAVAARAWADAIEASQALAIERDHAVATKAQIGSRREATAMATASATRKENSKLKEQLGFSARHATILQVEDAMRGDFDFVPLRRWCKANEVTPEAVPDKRYPGGVKAWPAGAWASVYGVDLVELFGAEVDS